MAADILFANTVVSGWHMDAAEWVTRFSARLHARWHTVSRAQRDEVAREVAALPRWRSMEPEQAAVEWLRQGIPSAA